MYREAIAANGGRLRSIARFVKRNAGVFVSAVLGPVAGRVADIATRELAHERIREAEADAISHVRRTARSVLTHPLLAQSSPRFAYDKSVQCTIASLASELRTEDTRVWVSTGHAEWFRLLAQDLGDLASATSAQTMVDVPYLTPRDKEALRALVAGISEAAIRARRCGELHSELSWNEERNAVDPLAAVRANRPATNTLRSEHASYARAVLAATDAAERLIETDR